MKYTDLLNFINEGYACEVYQTIQIEPAIRRRWLNGHWADASLSGCVLVSQFLYIFFQPFGALLVQHKFQLSHNTELGQTGEAAERSKRK